MPHIAAWVYLVDNDSERRQIVSQAARERGLSLECFSTLREFRAQCNPIRPACLIVQQRLLPPTRPWQLGGQHLATVVLWEEPSVADVVDAMRAGAVAVLSHPLDVDTVAHWLTQAVLADETRHTQALHVQQLTHCYQRLSHRKHLVLRHMIEGHASKWSAHELDVSRRTIELDRADILSTFQVSNAIELARRIGPWLEELELSSGSSASEHTPQHAPRSLSAAASTTFDPASLRDQITCGTLGSHIA